VAKPDEETLAEALQKAKQAGSREVKPEVVESTNQSAELAEERPDGVSSNSVAAASKAIFWMAMIGLAVWLGFFVFG
jgi:hypothetical protein